MAITQDSLASARVPGSLVARAQGGLPGPDSGPCHSLGCLGRVPLSLWNVVLHLQNSDSNDTFLWEAGWDSVRSSLQQFAKQITAAKGQREEVKIIPTYPPAVWVRAHLFWTPRDRGHCPGMQSHWRSPQKPTTGQLKPEKW